MKITKELLRVLTADEKELILKAQGYIITDIKSCRTIYSCDHSESLQLEQTITIAHKEGEDMSNYNDMDVYQLERTHGVDNVLSRFVLQRIKRFLFKELSDG